MSWHRQYRGQSIGRVLHFIYHYCGFDASELAQVGNGNVTYRREQIATYTWLNEVEDIPIFNFQGEHAEEYERNQKEKFFQAIRDQEAPKPEPCKECQSLKLELSIYKDAHKRK